MALIEAIGVLCVGIIVMWLTFYFISRFTSYTVTILLSIITILFAGAVLNFIQLADKTDFWYYPIGLVVGLALYGINARTTALPVLKFEMVKKV